MSSTTCRRHDLAAVEAAVIADRLAEAGEIAQRRRKAAAAAFGADAVDVIMRVLFRAHRNPDALGEKIGQRHAARPPADPGQHVGIDGLVGEGLAVLALLLLRAQEIENIGRAFIARLDRRHAVRPPQPEHAGILVGIDLGVFEARRHIHRLVHARITERAGLQLGHIVRDRRLRIDLALRHQNAGERAGERFCHRHRDVRLVRLQRAEIALVDQLAPVQHGDAVGIGLLEHARKRHRPPVHRDRSGRADIMLLARQHRRGPCPAPDIHRRHQLADIAPGPAQFGEAAERAVLEGDGFIRRRRKALHPAERLRIGLGGGCRLLAGCGRDGHRRLAPKRRSRCRTMRSPRAHPAFAPGDRRCKRLPCSSQGS